jgi:predicted RND superfamily exporter protein
VRAIGWMVRRRALSLAVLALTLLVSGYWATKIQVRFQYRDFYAYPANKDLPTFDRYSAQFGDPAGNVVVLLQADDVFQRPYLEYVDALSRDLEPSPLFSHVRSLSTVQLVRATGDGVEVGPIMSRVPDTQEGIEAVRRTALDSKLTLRRMVSKDSTATAVLAEMRTPAEVATVDEESAAIDVVREAVARRPPPPGLKATITGAPSIEVSMTHALLRDQLVLTPVVVGIIVLALLLSFRSIHGILLVLSAVTVSLVWTAGVFGAVGRPVDITGSIIPTTILVYGVVDPIFVLTRYLAKVELLGDRARALDEALAEMLLPCFLTSLTTALGFAAFITATMPTVRYLGVVVAIGVGFSFVTTVTVLPLLLSMVAPPRRALSSLAFPRALDALLARSWRALNARRGLVVAAAALLLVLGVAAGRGLRVNNSYVETAPDSPARRAVRVAEEKLSGVVRFIVYLEGEPGAMKRPEVLRAIAGVESAMEHDPMVTSSIGLPDLLAETNQAFQDGEASARSLPASAGLIAQYLTFIDPDVRDDFVSEDYARSHVRILAADEGGAAAKRFGEELQAAVDAQHFDALGVRVSLTGNGVVTYRELERIVVEILWGFVTAFAIVLAFEVVVFRSIRAALISVVPNLLPLGACFLAMRLARVDFRIDTALVLCISIGGLFNTTIHVIARALQRLRAGETDADATIEGALRAVGPASFYTAAILSAGFSALLLSSFPGLRALGGLAMITMLTAFFSDAVFTTTLMRVFYPWPRAQGSDRPPRPETASASPA